MLFEERYRSFGRYCEEKFGCKTYKLALGGGRTCPNRDGTVGYGGCSFCAEGSGSFAAAAGTVAEQIERAKTAVSGKIRGGKYIAYFQSFTATHGDVRGAGERFVEAAGRDDIAAVSVATRPDCLGDEAMEVLAATADIKPLFVELGLQTVNDKIAAAFNRGYPTSEYFRAADKLRRIGAEVVTHVILGLPGETEKDMYETVSSVGKVTDGIKLQLLHVLYGTRAAEDFASGKFETLSMEKYIDILCNCIELLPADVVVHRLTGDAPKRLLISPLWSADKKRVLNAVKREFCARDVVQGKRASDKGLNVFGKWRTM